VSEIEVSWCGTDVTILTLRGEHDLSNAHRLAAELRMAMRARELPIVDLSEVQFIDSSVLNNLWQAERMARERGLSLTLQLGTAAIVRRTLETSGLIDQLRCAPSRQEAITLARSDWRANGGRGG
jgi:anti-anti-sigma factor